MFTCSTTASITPCQQTTIASRNVIDLDKVHALIQQLKPLTVSSQDACGRTIQIWGLYQHKLVGTVLVGQGRLTIIPGRRIYNALNSSEGEENLARRLGSLALRNWDIVFDKQHLTLTVWPKLKAEGRFFQEYNQKGFQEAHSSAEGKLRGLQRHALDASRRPKNHEHFTAYNIEKKGGVVMRDGKPLINQRTNKPYDHVKEVRGAQTNAKKLILDCKLILSQPKLASDERQKVEQLLREASRTLDDSEKMTKAPSKPADGGGPGGKDFKQLLQQTRLTDSYNASHRNNPVPAKGATGGEIGGVACSMEYIEGLFDGPETLFERDHYFCLPQLPGGALPFTDGELRQILRELAIGIYAHSAVPFFSLHFRQGSADLFPVIHPIYQDTLVGRIIGLLDYWMKGYLNGSTFNEKFIDDWHKNPNWKKNGNSALQNLIDLSAYCRQRMEDPDKQYVSLRDMEEAFSTNGPLLDFLGVSTTNESPALANFEGFKNSFRIIAKQNSYQKTGNVFVIDADFDVLHTIDPSPEYKEAVIKHLRKHEESPASYESMESMYRFMEKQIHDHMVKMPMCREYFSMLGVINFFSSYFSTLKKHRKIPVLSVQEKVETKGCPPLFPHIPLLQVSSEVLRIHPKVAISLLIREHRTELLNYFSRYLDYLFAKSAKPTDEEVQRLQASCFASVEQSILSLCSEPFKRFLLKNGASIGLDKIVNSAFKQLFGVLQQSFESSVSGVPGSSRPHLIKEAFVAKFLDKVPELFQAQKINLTKKQNFRTAFTHAELKPKVIDKNSRVVGGCGMRLEAKSLQPSRGAAYVLEHNWDKLQALPPESWTSVNMDGSPGAAFRLIFEDVPSWINEDYSWMEFFLFAPKGGMDEKILEKKLAIFEAMSTGNHEDFINRIAGVHNLQQITNLQGASLLCYAARMADPFYTEQLLKKGLSPIRGDASGYLPIHYAAMRGALKSMSLLIAANKRSINAVSHNGSTPLIVAIQNNQLGAVETLLERKLKPALLAGGYTDLHCALHEGNFGIITAVLADDALIRSNINVCCLEGGTPLMLACELDDPECVLKLIHKGADPGAKRADGVTPIEIAIRRDCIPVLNVLLSKVAPTSVALEVALQEASVEVIKVLIENTGSKFARLKNSCRDTPALVATRSANIPVALYLAEKFPRRFAVPNIEEITALDLALRMGIWPVVELLHHHGLSPEIDLLLKAPYHSLVKKILNERKLSDDDLQKYLLIAAQAGNYLAITQALMPLGAKLDEVRGPKGWRLLHYLAKADGIFLFKQQMFRSLDLLSPLVEEENKTLPYIAAENKSSRVLLFLLDELKEKGIDLKNHFKGRHLFYGVIESRETQNVEKMMEVFQDHHLENVALDANQTKPLHLAAQIGSKKIVDLLLAKGVDLNAKDAQNRTALYYAVRLGDEKSVQRLLEKGAQIGPHELYQAASGKHNAILKRLAEKKPLQGALDHALYLAIWYHDFSCFSVLNHLGATFNYTNKGWTPLLLASYTGQVEIFETILSLSPGYVLSSKGNTPLHVACMGGQVHCVERLLSKGFSPSVPNATGKLPLDLAKDNAYIANMLKGNSAPYQGAVEAFVAALREDNPEKMENLLRSLPPELQLFIEYENQKICGTSILLLARFANGREIKTSLRNILRRLSSDHKKTDSQGDSLAHLLVQIGISPLDYPHLSLDGRNHAGQSVLHIAAKTASASLLEALIKAVPELVNGEDNQGQTPVFYALLEQKKDNVQIMLDHGANPAHRDHAGLTPLFVACGQGSLSAMKSLLNAGADPCQPATANGDTPLHQTIIQKNTELTRFLLLHGAVLNAITEKGDHFIHFAARVGDVELLRLLAAQGVSLDLQGSLGKQPVHEAAIHGQKALLQNLTFLQGGYKDVPMEEIEIKAQEGQTEITKKSLEGATPLHLAARFGTPEVIDWLLKNKANPEAKTKDGLDSLSLAAQNDGAKGVLPLLYQYKISQKPSSLLSAVQGAIMVDNVDALTALFHQGVQIDTEIVAGNTALHFASLYGALQCTSWLLQKGANPLQQNKENQTVFELAALNTSSDQFRCLLEFTEQDPDASYSNGRALLHLAANKGNLKHVLLLMSLGAYVNIKDDVGMTPLHVAASGGQAAIIRFLLACGADATSRAFNGKLPKECTPENCPEVIQVFSDYGMAMTQVQEGESPLHFAVRMRSAPAVIFLAQSEGLDQPNRENETALSLAVRTGQTDLIPHLRRLGPASCP